MFAELVGAVFVGAAAGGTRLLRHNHQAAKNMTTNRAMKLKRDGFIDLSANQTASSGHSNNSAYRHS